jgi:prephenate dehydrogenase
VGVVGFGNFGRFLAGQLQGRCDVAAWDLADLADNAAQLGVAWEPLDQLLGRPIIIPAVPARSLEQVLARVPARPDTLIVDVCSVKTMPIELMHRFLPAGVEFIATHPLFGPQSGADGIAGLKIAVCPPAGSAVGSEQKRDRGKIENREASPPPAPPGGRGGLSSRITPEHYERFCQFLSDDLGLNVIETTPEEHDRQMAAVQGLTHFLARAVQEMDLPDSPLATLAYDRLREILGNVAEDSADLFMTIQRDNPFAEAMRDRLMYSLEHICKRIGSFPMNPRA